MKFTIFLLTLLFSSTSLVAKPETPTSLNGATVVDATQVKKLLSEGAVVVDVRKGLEYAEAHIKGAVSIPYKEKSAKKPDFDASKDKWKTKKLPADKNTKIVLYCNGPTCWKSFKSSKMAVSKGYKNVFWFRTGIPAWKKAGLPTE